MTSIPEAMTTRPVAMTRLRPKRSANDALRGAVSTIMAAMGSRATPARSGE